MALRPCLIDECDGIAGKPGTARGWCSAHYQRWKNHGDPLADVTRRRSVCEIDECEKFVKTNGLCSMHESRLRRKGSPEARLAGEVVDGKRICPGCGEDKAVADFSPNKATKSGVAVYCKPCQAMKTAASRQRPGWVRSPRDCQQARQYSRSWRAANPEKVRANHDAYKARKAGAMVEDFTRKEILDRDGWKCHICSTDIDPQLPYPHPLSASLDHVVPLIRGGAHSRANVAAAHFTCNSSKRDRVW
jgi:5-methylcytosine-specific restriction endonuclease McrA